tara:strand:- start:4472 stop:4786 length:315 start_codon:yes stop_codon:yes gene_type:complete
MVEFILTNVLIFFAAETYICTHPAVGNKAYICSWEEEDFRIMRNDKEGTYDASELKRSNPNDNKIEAYIRKKYWKKRNEEWRAQRELDTTSGGVNNEPRIRKTD